MQPHNRQTLEALRPDYDNWIANKNLGNFAWQEVQRIIREEWDGGYTVQYWCGTCLVEMLTMAFRRMDGEQEPAAVETIKIKLRES